MLATEASAVPAAQEATEEQVAMVPSVRLPDRGQPEQPGLRGLLLQTTHGILLYGVDPQASRNLLRCPTQELAIG